MFKNRMDLMNGVSGFALDPLICSIGEEGDGDTGAGSSVSIPDQSDDSDPSGFDQGGDQSPRIDLDSTDPAVIYSEGFPRNRKLSAAQIQAVMNYNPLADRQTAPAVQPPQQRQPTTPQQQQPVETQYGILPQGYRITQKGQIIGPDNRFVAANKVPWIKKPKGQTQPAPARTPQPAAPQGGMTAEQVQQLISGFTNALQTREPASAQPADQPQAPRHMYGPQGIKPAITIPPQIFEMIESDDPNKRAQGITFLMNGVANTVFQDIGGLLRALREDILENHVPAILSRQRTESASRDAFYNRYPQLRKPELSGFISHISRTIAQEWQAHGYDWRDPADRTRPSEMFMDAVAGRYMQLVGLQSLPETQPTVAQQTQPSDSGQVIPLRPTSPAGPSRAPAATPYFPQQGARPPAASPASSKSEEIRNVIFSR